MEKESIAYFYLQYGETAKKHFRSKPEAEKKTVERERFVIHVRGIPENYAESLFRRKKLPWKQENLKRFLLDCFQECEAEYFFCGEESARFFGQEKVSPPFFIMGEMLLQYGIRENLFLIGSPNPLFESVFQNCMERVNFLQIVCEDAGEYESDAEWLYEIYGLVATFRRVSRKGARAERAAGSRRGEGRYRAEDSRRDESRYRTEDSRRDESRQWMEESRRNEERQRAENVLPESAGRAAEALVIDMEPAGKNGRPAIDLALLPRGTVYMDMRSETKKKHWITKKRKDIHYLSPETALNKWCHLDTTAQNGYNTRVKLEVL